MTSAEKQGCVQTGIALGIVVHPPLHTDKINKYKNKGKSASNVLSPSRFRRFLLCVNYAWRTHEVCGTKESLHASEYRPSANGGVVVVLDQRRLQMRRRVRSGRVPGVICQKGRRGSGVGRATARR